MMKKLLTLFLVLAMVSAASAATFEIAVDDVAYTGQDILPSQYVTLTLYDADNMFIQVVQTFATISATAADNYSHVWAAGGIGSNNFTADGAGYDWSGNQTWNMVELPADDVVFTHTFHVPVNLVGSDEILVTWDMQYGGFYPGDPINGQFFDGEVLMHVVPEPMTFCLLGLGGLFLRRRKK